MQNPMTAISQRIYEEATSGLTVQEAAAFLEKEAKIRTFKEKLEQFSQGSNLRTVLVEGLMHNHPELSKDSVERRVRGWLQTGSSRSVRKNDAIELCFILNLSVEEADAFVALVSEEGLHWRSPDEIVYIYALKQRMDYLEALNLNEEMQKYLTEVRETKSLAENSFTPVIRSEVTALCSKEELADYLADAASRLGRYHNNAYRLFMDMLYTLEHPQFYETVESAEVFQKERLTIREILKEYMFEGNVLYAKEIVRAGKKRSSQSSHEDRLVFSIIQEKVSESWPDETTISKMKSRKADVTRKALILLFLATDTGFTQEDEEDFEYELSTDEIFEDLYQRLNDMLLQCGFQVLDPRSPFDWLVLYCICVEDMFDIDIRMKAIFKEMFGERE